jgi:hypothetical protein
MSSDQQKMYDYASSVASLLSARSPDEEKITQIRDVVVSGPSLLLLTISEYL